MFSFLFNTFIYNPLYNALVFLLDVIPGADVGIAVIVLTVVVKLILFPLSKKAARTQIEMRALQPKLEEIKKKHKDNPQQQAQLTMQLYKEHNINPFSGIFLILLQLPVIFALYFVFLRGGLPDINIELLYSFVGVPGAVDMNFFGFLDVTSRSVMLALITGISQYAQISLATPKPDKNKKPPSTLSETFASSMQTQMRYGMPVIVTIIAYTLPALIGLYWTTSNLFMIGQELVVRRGLAAQKEKEKKT